MSIRRKWLRLVFLVMLAWSAFSGPPLNPKEIEDLLHTMNESQIERSAADQGNNSGCDPRQGA
jgi:hypothetical protein